MDKCPGCGLETADVAAHMETRHKSKLEDWVKPPDTTQVVGDAQKEITTNSGVIVVRDVPTEKGGYL